MNSFNSKSIACYFGGFLCAVFQGSAAILVDFIDTTSVQLEITEEIEFTIKEGLTEASLRNLVFVDWLSTADSERTRLGAFNGAENPITVRINDDEGQERQFTPNNLYDNSFTLDGDIDPNDGFLSWTNDESISFSTVTVLPGTYQFGRDGNLSEFNPNLNGFEFTGEVFIANAAGNRQTNIVVVPEPATFILPFLAACFVATARRRKAVLR